MVYGDKLTIKDIAKKVDVSITTVSRVINDKPDVNSETRAKVLEVIEKLDYKPNNVARGLVLNQTFSIGLIIPDINNPFFPEVARGIEDIANESDYSVIFSSTDNKVEREKKAVDLMLQKKVDGLILSLSMQNKDTLRALEKQEFPVVQLDRNIPGSYYPTVMINHKDSAYRATNYLLNNGFKKITHISGAVDTFPGQERKKGFVAALKEWGYDDLENFIVKGNFSRESGYKAMIKILNSSDLPEAIFAANDMMALGVYQACKENNLKVPNDIAVMGHDNIELSNLVDPSLTTMKQPKYKLGEIAFSKLLEIIKSKENKEEIREVLPENKIFSTQLIIRDSTKNN